MNIESLHLLIFEQVAHRTESKVQNSKIEIKNSAYSALFSVK